MKVYFWKIVTRNCSTANTCANGAECVDVPSIGITCKCRYGYTGKNCNIKTCALLGICQHGGKCTDVAGVGVKCDCGWYYTGSNCESGKLNQWIKINSKMI